MSNRTTLRRLAQLAVSLGLASLALYLAAHGNQPIFTMDPLLPIDRGLRFALSLLLGLALGTAVVFAARRWIVSTKAGQRWLETMGAPLADRTDPSPIPLPFVTIVAAASEELTFRGLLVPAFGVTMAALMFAVLHGLAPREARIAWVMAAFAFGLALGALYVVTGDLSGPIVAHVLVNAANTRWIRGQYERQYGRERNGETARRSGAKPLGGLLGPRV